MKVYKKLNLSDFRRKLNVGDYSSLVGAKRAIGRFEEWDEFEREDARRIAEAYFGGGGGRANPSTRRSHHREQYDDDRGPADERRTRAAKPQQSARREPPRAESRERNARSSAPAPRARESARSERREEGRRGSSRPASERDASSAPSKRNRPPSRPLPPEREPSESRRSPSRPPPPERELPARAPRPRASAAVERARPVAETEHVFDEKRPRGLELMEATEIREKPGAVSHLMNQVIGSVSEALSSIKESRELMSMTPAEVDGELRASIQVLSRAVSLLNTDVVGPIARSNSGGRVRKSKDAGAAPAASAAAAPADSEPDAASDDTPSSPSHASDA